jgi:hypothetical protein
MEGELLNVWVVIKLLIPTSPFFAMNSFLTNGFLLRSARERRGDFA